MKKILFTFILAITSIITYSNTDSTVTNIENKTREISNFVANQVSAIDTSKVSHKIYEGLSQLAAGLKTTADNVWDITVRQQLVYSIANLILGIFMFFIVRYIIFSGYRRYVNYNEAYNKATNNVEGYRYYAIDEGSWLANFIVGSTLGIISIALFILNIQQTITGFVNPEFGAMRQIIEFVSQIR